MKKQIELLKKIASQSTSVDQAAETFSSTDKRFSKRASKQIMLDIKDHLDGIIDETKLSLFLKSHGL